VPFYQRLVKELSNQTKTHIIAVLPENPDESRKYLEEKMLKIPDTIQISSKEIQVRGTPTLLLINDTGTVLEQWTGKLPNKSVEEQVIQRLTQ
jgi:thioredoxin-related protein